MKHQIYNEATGRGFGVMSRRPVDLSKCRESVSTKSGFQSYQSHQCARKFKVFERVEGHEDKLGFCRQHSAAYVEDKLRKEEEKRKRKRINDRREQQNKRSFLGLECYRAIYNMSEGEAASANVHPLWKKVQRYEAGP